MKKMNENEQSKNRYVRFYGSREEEKNGAIQRLTKATQTLVAMTPVFLSSCLCLLFFYKEILCTVLKTRLIYAWRMSLVRKTKMK